MSKVKSSPTYQFTNPHPLGLSKEEDCVYRAMSIATGKTWLEIYDEITQLGREILCTPNGKRTIDTYLDKIGTREPAIKNGKRTTGKDLAKRKDGKTYVISTAHHLACIKDGKVRDTWDSGNKSGYLIWEIN